MSLVQIFPINMLVLFLVMVALQNIFKSYLAKFLFSVYF